MYNCTKLMFSTLKRVWRICCILWTIYIFFSTHILDINVQITADGYKHSMISYNLTNLLESAISFSHGLPLTYVSGGDFVACGTQSSDQLILGSFNSVFFQLSRLCRLYQIRGWLWMRNQKGCGRNKMLSWQLPGKAEENQEKPHTRQPTSPKYLNLGLPKYKAWVLTTQSQCSVRIFCWLE